MVEHKIKSVETGIVGLDKILNGGIPIKNQVLLTGGPGSGKTIIGFEILYNCAKNGIPCAFIALDQNPESIIKNFKSAFPDMGDVDKLLKEKLIVVEGYDTASKISVNTENESPYSMGNLISEMDGIIKSANAKVVVVDSLSFLKLMLGKTILYNKSVASLISKLRRLEVTSILTFSTPYHSRKKMKFGQEMLLFDGIISLYKEDNAQDFSIEVVKMRGNSHDRGEVRYEITQEGVKFK